MAFTLATYYRKEDIPELPGESVFHSKELFQIYEATPGYAPFLVVATNDGVPVARLLAAVRRTKKWLPSFLSRQCIVYGAGEILMHSLSYSRRESVFAELLKRVVKETSRTCFMIEFRNLESATFGYRFFRDNKFFPVNWLRVRNSLHSVKKVEERFSPSRIRQVKKGLRNGAIVMDTNDPEDIRVFSNMLSKIYSLRIRRHFPDTNFFLQFNDIMIQRRKGKAFIVKYKEKIIGGAVCIYSKSDAYLWFSGGMRKTYAPQYPGVLAVWKALQDAHANGFRHMEFLDVGLPFRKHGYRNFVLRFGGKQSSTRRWFRINCWWLNKLLTKMYI